MISGPPHPVISPMVLFLLWSLPGEMDLMDIIMFTIQWTLRSGDYASEPLPANEPLVRATSRQPQNWILPQEPEFWRAHNQLPLIYTRELGWAENPPSYADVGPQNCGITSRGSLHLWVTSCVFRARLCKLAEISGFQIVKEKKNYKGFKRNGKWSQSGVQKLEAITSLQ